MSQFWSESVHKLEPYIPGEQPKNRNLIKLNTNENPYGPSPIVLDVLKQNINDELRLYPDPNSDELKTAIADYYSLSEQQVFVGNGSDEVLAHVFQGLLKHDKPLLFPDITYSFYPVYCGLYGIDYQTIPLTDAFEIDFSTYPTENGGIILPNPNAPTGVALPLGSIEALLKKNTDSVVVIDEAYIDFGGESAASLVGSYPNLLVIQTLSKSRSLAGLRVGFALGHKGLIEGLERIKNSFNSYPMDRLAQKGAVAALKDETYFDETRKKIIASRDYLSQSMNELGFNVLPSAANFIFAMHPKHDAATINKYLREQNIIVRYFKLPRIDQHLRITIGTQAECESLVVALKRFLTAA